MTHKSVIKLHAITSFFATDQKLIEKGENAYNSGHVKNGLFDESLSYIQGKVQASMKDRDYLVKINLDNAGRIEESNCTCPRGQVRCHHMAALLLYCMYNISVTDVACSWTTRRPLDNDVKTVAELYPRNKKYTATSGLSDTKKAKFYQSLKNKSVLVGFSWILSPEPDCSVEKTLEDFIFSTEFENTVNKKEALLDFSYLSANKITNIYHATIGQRNNPRWLIERKHRLTASNFGIILKACRLGKFTKSLFKTLSGSYSLGGVKSINWGIENEVHAVHKFEEITGLNVVPCGFMLHENGLLGASPDGVVTEEDSLLEVKCPFKYRGAVLDDVLKTDNSYFLTYDEETGRYVVKKEHNYYDQIQGQLYISKKTMCNFVTWTPHSVIVVEIYKDEEWESNLEVLTNFYIHKYIPYLLSKSGL